MDYVATYPTNGITYRSNNMNLSDNSDAAYLNVSKSPSFSGAHIFLSEEDPKPRCNGPILAIAQIINFVVSSADEAELAALFITTKDMVPLRQNIIEMKWTQGRSPTQPDNYTAVGFTNITIVPKRTESMGMRFHFLRYRMVQVEFRFYWAPGPENLGDYSTKHQLPLYHLAHRPTHAG